MCFEERYYKDCGHLAYRGDVWCENSHVNLLTGEYTYCSASRNSRTTQFVVLETPGHCDTHECWLKARIRYGWRCHRCLHKNGGKQGRFCRGHKCGHEVCSKCSSSFLKCCYDGHTLRRGAKCKVCSHQSCSRCEYCLQ
ncbi:hypothetical protein PgNI_11196 [Pyricularia grisea]|uniref:Uncharacterized protein n=1 Tax=Pyricularia grisea TaxID=148305 RepID=A0A6P8APD5_PYRGI|nr:hypothetical protein PgNI_11196 [Pyricularia grisea]TLD03895.1 hypothetical protein PgNI_11196 [Pyricularia grisea]